MEVFGLLALLYLTALSPAEATPEPLSVQWNTDDSFGPDGPWQGVELTIGSPGQTVTLYPGAMYGSVVFSSQFCDSSDPTQCPAITGGVFNVSASDSANNRAISYTGPGDDWSAGSALNQTVRAVNVLDDQQIYSTLDRTAHSIKHAVFSAVTSMAYRTANDTVYNPRVGFLSMGGPSPNQTFAGTPNVNGSLIPGYLSTTGSIPSSSFGLHIGSVPMGQVGSLIFGGYDQSRLLGSVASFSVSSNLAGVMPLELLDVELGVEVGGSPFNSSQMTGFLQRDGNATVQTLISPAFPYMALPFGTCEAIAEQLPVRWLDGLGLYAWNTDDPQYKKIVTSPAYMGFVFEQPAGAGNLTIKVPFPLLDLTLESPLTAISTPYWPCKPSPPESNVGWLLGRAFLQATYVALDWDSQTFFVAQGAGPGGSPSLIQAMDDSTTPPSSSQQQLSDTWGSKWTPLPDAAAAGTTDTAISTSAASSSSGLSTGAEAGIGAGAGAVVILAIVGGILLWRRRRSRHRGSGAYGQAASVSSSQYSASQYSASPVPGELVAERYPPRRVAGELMAERYQQQGVPGELMAERYQPRKVPRSFSGPMRHELDRSEVRRPPVELPPTHAGMSSP